MDLKPTRTFAKRRARRDWQSSGSPSAKLRQTEASTKLRKTLHEEEELKETEFIEDLSRDHKTNYYLWKATKTVKREERKLVALKKRLLYLLITYQKFLSQIHQKINFLLQLSTKLWTMLIL